MVNPSARMATGSEDTAILSEISGCSNVVENKSEDIGKMGAQLQKQQGAQDENDKR